MMRPGLTRILFARRHMHAAVFTSLDWTVVVFVLNWPVEFLMFQIIANESDNYLYFIQVECLI